MMHLFFSIIQEVRDHLFLTGHTVRKQEMKKNEAQFKKKKKKSRHKLQHKKKNSTEKWLFPSEEKKTSSPNEVSGRWVSHVTFWATGREEEFAREVTQGRNMQAYAAWPRFKKRF